MRIVVLGGAGDMGAEAVRDLVKYSGADEIIVADRNMKAAKKLAAKLDPSRVKAREIDATRHNELVDIMRGSAAVAGALGPFYRFEKPIVEAAIAAGANYVSICDDHDAAEAVLALDDQARQNGRRILTGMGWTPGLSNLLARRGYDELESAGTINIYWAAGAADSEGLAVILHTMHIFTGKVTSFRDGNAASVKAGSGKEQVTFPEPMGTATTFHVGHPEPVTLPRYMKGLIEVTLKGGLAENYLNYLSKAVAALGLTRTPFTRQVTGRILKTLLPVLPRDRNRSVSGIRVDISGSRNGQPVTISYAVTDNMRRLTGIPLSIGTIMMAENRINRYGVFGPEAENAVDSKTFLSELERRGINVCQRELS